MPPRVIVLIAFAIAADDFSLDIELGDGSVQPLVFSRDDDFVRVARTFCADLAAGAPDGCERSIAVEVGPSRRACAPRRRREVRCTGHPRL